MPQSGFAFSVPEAVGVMGVLLPDSNPLYSLVTLLGAAVATGNAVIIVPSQKYPLPGLTFIQVCSISVNTEIQILHYSGKFKHTGSIPPMVGFHYLFLLFITHFKHTWMKTKSCDLNIDIDIINNFSFLRCSSHVTCQQV